MPNSFLPGQILRSVFWSYLGTVLQRLLEPLLILVLAYYLTPDAFGLMAIAASVIALVRQLQTMGLGEALIQVREDADSAAHTIFWMNLGLGSVLFSLIFVSAPAVAEYFGDDRLLPILRVLSTLLLISAFETVQDAYLRRLFAFKKLMLRRLLPLVAQAVLTIALAHLGYAYWALVWGAVARGLISVLCLWWASPWRPVWRFEITVARRSLRFGGLVTLGTLQGWVLMQGDRLVAGRVLGIETVGIYDFGMNIANLVALIICEPIYAVCYPAFARVQQDREALIRQYHQFVRGLSALLLPACMALALLAPLGMSQSLDGKWAAAIPVVCVFAISPGIARLLNVNVMLYRAINRPDIEPWFNLAQLLFLIPAYGFGVQFGLLGLVLARASVGVVFWLPHVWVARRLLGCPPGFFWSAFSTPLAAALVMTAAMGLALWFWPSGGSPLLQICVVAGMGATTYSIVWSLLDPVAVSRVLAGGINLLGRKSP